MSVLIDRLRIFSADATVNTTWLFVEASLDDGTRGWGEATLNGREAEVIRLARRLFPALTTGTVDQDGLKRRLPFGSLPEAALSSAVLQALSDGVARRAGIPLAVSLGGQIRDRIGLYANINRRTRDRTPEGMANSARDASAAGFDAIKIAPFDEVRPDLDRAAMGAATDLGLERIAAVRGALGGSARLMVDCHWRFDEAGAVDMIRAAAPLAPYWIECPVSESPDRIDTICRLRAVANTAGIRLAGLETQILARGFQPYLVAGAYDVLMPDVKYAGGPEEMMRIADLFDRYGVDFSPHNPSGPICHAHSLHICAGLGASDLMELQFNETPVFDALVNGEMPVPNGGIAAPDPDRPGLGLTLSGDASLLTEFDVATGWADR